MKKIIGSALFFTAVLLLTACSSGGQQQKMTALDLLQKSQEATEDSLQSVHAHINFDDYAVTIIDGDIENPEKAGLVADMQIDAYLKPLQVKQQTRMQPRGIKAYDLQLYETEDGIFTKQEDEEVWQRAEDNTISSLFGSLADAAHPTVDLTKFEPFADQFKMEPIEYGYALRMTLDREGFKKFKEIFPDAGPKEEGFLIVDKFELVITFNKSTSYVTSIKLASDMRAFNDGNVYRSRQKLNATYSYFNDITDFTVPEAATAAGR